MSAATEAPEEAKPFGRLRCVMYVLYYGVEYVLGRFWLWWQFGKHRALVVSDRYFHEYALQRQFERCPRWLLALLMKVIARPDALVYLRASPELMHARKGERTAEELRRQCALCEERVARAPNGYVVDSVSEDLALADLQRIVVEILAAKQASAVWRLYRTVAEERGRGNRV